MGYGTQRGPRQTLTDCNGGTKKVSISTHFHNYLGANSYIIPQNKVQRFSSKGKDATSAPSMKKSAL